MKDFISGFMREIFLHDTYKVWPEFVSHFLFLAANTMLTPVFL